jgi:hypothetical protein
VPFVAAGRETGADRRGARRGHPDLSEGNRPRFRRRAPARLLVAWPRFFSPSDVTAHPLARPLLLGGGEVTTCTFGRVSRLQEIVAGGQVGSRRRRTTVQGLVGEHDNLHGAVSRPWVQLVPSTKHRIPSCAAGHTDASPIARARTEGWPPFSRGRRPQLALDCLQTIRVMAPKTAHPSVQRLRPRCIAKLSTNCAKCFQSASEIRFSIDNKGPYNGLQDKGQELTLP